MAALLRWVSVVVAVVEQRAVLPAMWNQPNSAKACGVCVCVCYRSIGPCDPHRRD